MWFMAVPVTAKGLEALAHGATTLFGALTALLGFMMGTCGFIWWLRRLRRQRVKMQLEEMQLKVWMEGQKKRHKPRLGTGNDSEE